MSARTVITVDGLAGSGKSTLARHLAGRLGFVHLNSGLLYRAVGLMALRSRIDVHNEASLGEELAKHSIRLDLAASGSPCVELDGEDITSAVQAPEVSESTSKAAQFPVVREALLQLQRDAFPGRNIIAEGRDMGTVVFPDAGLKFFIVADEGVRVERRLRQLLEQSSDKSPAFRAKLEQQIGIEIRERDRRDSERRLAPTKAAGDAIIINNSKELLENVVSSMVRCAADRGIAV